MNAVVEKRIPPGRPRRSRATAAGSRQPVTNEWATPGLDAAGVSPDTLVRQPGSNVCEPRHFALRITTGLQAGARVALMPDRDVTVGQQEADDVRLRDPAVSGARLALGIDEAGVRVDWLAGAVCVDGKALEPGRSVRWVPGQTLMLGEVSCRVDAATAMTASPVRGDPARGRDAPASGYPLCSPVSADAQVPVAAVPSDSIRPTIRPRRAARLGALVLVALAIVPVWWAGERALAPQDVLTVSAASLLDGSVFAGLDVAEREGRAIIDGVVPDRAALAELDAMLARSTQPVVSRVETDTTLADKVLDVLRVNGAEAELTSSNGGHVVASTALPISRDLQELADIVQGDVPALASLKLNNTPPPVARAPSGRLDPGKRVAMVVSAAPAHVITDDESRYFIGSLLPSGHRIVAIVDNRVSLERDGERTNLEF